MAKKPWLRLVVDNHEPLKRNGNAQPLVTEFVNPTALKIHKCITKAAKREKYNIEFFSLAWVRFGKCNAFLYTVTPTTADVLIKLRDVPLLQQYPVLLRWIGEDLTVALKNLFIDPVSVIYRITNGDLSLLITKEN